MEGSTQSFWLLGVAAVVAGLVVLCGKSRLGEFTNAGWPTSVVRN